MTSSAAAPAPDADRPPSAAAHRPRLGVVAGMERDTLAATFGALLRSERLAARLTQEALAERAGSARHTLTRLEGGSQRPSTGMCWRLAKALRPNASLRDQVALDVRLQLAAGSSLRRFSRRTHARRERLAAELLAEHAVPLSDSDDFAAICLDMIATGEVPDA